VSREVRLAYAAWITVCLVWGTTYLAIKVALETVPPMLMGGMRYAMAGLLLGLILRWRGVTLPGTAAWPGLALLGFLLLGLGNGGVIWAEQWVASGLAAVLVATSPFWMVGLDAVLPGGDRLRGRHLLGLLVGFFGVLLLLWGDLQASWRSGAGLLAGIVALQIACMGWALGSAYGRRRSRSEDALGAATLQMIFGGAIMLLAGTALGEWSRLHFNLHTALAFGHLVVFGSILGFPAYVYALKHLPVSTVSLYAYVNPVIAVTLGTVVLDEPFHLRMLLAAGLILAGVAVVRSTSSAKTGEPEQASDRGTEPARGRNGCTQPAR
jgi:drug/metabolite transporter (DMT)-like permease